ncbi:peptidase S66 [Anopheles sinensis]|uniref:Peptidase S66 n=1 Tax=Anopheles sinensis TaxID=74873 RepID=A0A084VZ13_ANOSI|nr:peptidase S66 [Anopheles sinensis]
MVIVKALSGHSHSGCFSSPRTPWKLQVTSGAVNLGRRSHPNSGPVTLHRGLVQTTVLSGDAVTLRS